MNHTCNIDDSKFGIIWIHWKWFDLASTGFIGCYFSELRLSTKSTSGQIGRASYIYPPGLSFEKTMCKSSSSIYISSSIFGNHCEKPGGFSHFFTHESGVLEWVCVFLNENVLVYWTCCELSSETWSEEHCLFNILKFVYCLCPCVSVCMLSCTPCINRVLHFCDYVAIKIQWKDMHQPRMTQSSHKSGL